MTPKILHPTQYKNCIITPHSSGYDIIDPRTRRWFTVDSQKRAKWWSSVISRAQNEFMSNPPLYRTVPKPVEDHTPTTKGKP
jgi:hypothetical protein